MPELEVTERMSHGSPAFFVKQQFVALHPDGHHDDRFPRLWCAARRVRVGEPGWDGGACAVTKIRSIGAEAERARPYCQPPKAMVPTPGTCNCAGISVSRETRFPCRDESVRIPAARH